MAGDPCNASASQILPTTIREVPFPVHVRTRSAAFFQLDSHRASREDPEVRASTFRTMA
jgi:hypothetical protein